MLQLGAERQVKLLVELDIVLNESAEQLIIPSRAANLDATFRVDISVNPTIATTDTEGVPAHRRETNLVFQQLGIFPHLNVFDNVAFTLQVIGKSRSHVANTLRLLKLPESIRDMLVDGSLSAGHARTLVTAEDPAALAQKIIRDGLSVRQAEALAQKGNDQANSTSSKRVDEEKDADTKALEQLLSDVTGLKVAVNHRDKGGEVRIAYKTLEQLDDLCRRLQR